MTWEAFAVLVAIVALVVSGVSMWINWALKQAADRSATAAERSAREAERSADAAEQSASAQSDALTIERERRADEQRAELVAVVFSGKLGLVVSNTGKAPAIDVVAYRLWNSDLHREPVIPAGGSVNMRTSWEAVTGSEEFPPVPDDLPAQYDPAKKAYFLISWSDGAAERRTTGWRLIPRT